MYGTKTDILLEKILKNVGVFSTSPHFYNVEFNPYSTKTERLLYLIEINTRILAYIVPPGGNAGEVLTKASNSDYDSEWSSIASILGYTPADDSLVVHLAGAETITGTKTFTTNQIIDTSSSSAALRITQTGTGEAIRVEDSTNPDTSPFVVAADGKVGIGTGTPSYFLEAVSSGAIDTVLMFDGGSSANANLVVRADTSIKIPSFVISDRANAYTIVSSFYIGLDRSPSSLFAGRNDVIYVNNYTNKGHYFVTANASGVKAIRMSITPSGQVSIGNSSPNSSAAFQVDSTTQGILIPRLTTTQRTAISTPATSLMVYDTNLNSFYYYTGTAWAALGGGTGAGTLPTGGTTGQILAKNSATDYDTLWIDNYTSTVQHTVKLAESINKGQAVYVSSATGTNMLVSKADNSTEATSSKTMGLLAFTGVTNDQGFVVTEGLLAGFDTSTANAEGDPVWLGTSGNLLYGLSNKPVAPAHLVFIGIVTRKHAVNGEVFVKVQNGFEVRELHDVDATSPSNNDGLFYNSTNYLWEHKSIATALGYTPYNATNPNGYIDSSALSPYLTSATAASTYQPIGTYATASNSMSFTNKSGNISQWTNDSAYITSSALTGYLTSATAASTYQTIITGAATSDTTSNLTASRVLVSDASGKITTNAVTTTTLGYLDATSSIQTQLNSKLSTSSSIQNNVLAQALAGAASPTTRYHSISGTISTLTTAYQVPLPTACTFGNFYFRIYSAQPASGSLVLTLQKNAVDTASTITIAAGSAIGNYTDNTNTVSFVAGDTWQIKIVQNATSGSTNMGGYSFKLTGV